MVWPRPSTKLLLRLGPAVLADLLADVTADPWDRALAADELSSHGEAAAPYATETWIRETEVRTGSSNACAFVLKELGFNLCN